MKKTNILLIVAGAASICAAATVNNANKHAYGAYLGWLNAQGDVANGAVIGEHSVFRLHFGAPMSAEFIWAMAAPSTV